MIADMNKLTATTECPCGTLAVRYHAGIPCCKRCYEIEVELEHERLSRARRAMREIQLDQPMEELAA